MKYYLSINLYFVVLVLIPAGIQSFSEWKTNVKLHSINYCGTIAGRGSQTEKGEAHKKCYKTESSHRFCCLNRKFLRVRHMPSLLIWSPSCPLNSILAPIKRSLWLMLDEQRGRVVVLLILSFPSSFTHGKHRCYPHYLSPARPGFRMGGQRVQGVQ